MKQCIIKFAPSVNQINLSFLKLVINFCFYKKKQKKNNVNSFINFSTYCLYKDANLRRNFKHVEYIYLTAVLKNTRHTRLSWY